MHSKHTKVKGVASKIFLGRKLQESQVRESTTNEFVLYLLRSGIIGGGCPLPPPRCPLLSGTLTRVVIGESVSVFRVQQLRNWEYCVAPLGCLKRKKRKADEEIIRSDSEGSDDAESSSKRKLPRTFVPLP